MAAPISNKDIVLQQRDLLGQIFSYLPLSQIYQNGLVCKNWNHVAEKGQFLIGLFNEDLRCIEQSQNIPEEKKHTLLGRVSSIDLSKRVNFEEGDWGLELDHFDEGLARLIRLQGNLLNLRALDLSNSSQNFDAPIERHIDLSSFRGLRNLSLKNCYLSERSRLKFPASIHSLDLSGNQLNPVGFEQINLEELVDMEKFTYEKRGLTTSSTLFLAPRFSKKLKELRLQLGNLSRDAVICFRDHLPDTIQKLSLNLENFDGILLKDLKDHLPKSLIQLDLYVSTSKKISQTNLLEFIEALPSNLEKLNFFATKFDYEGRRDFSFFAQVLTSLPRNLRHLGLIFCSLMHKEEFDCLSSYLPKNLTSLNLYGNIIEPSEAQDLVMKLSDNVKELNLSGMELSEGLQREILKIKRIDLNVFFRKFS